MTTTMAQPQLHPQPQPQPQLAGAQGDAPRPRPAAAEGLVYGCLTHVPLWIDFPDYVTPVCLGQAQGPGRQNLRDLAPEWEPYHPVLGGAAGIFALKNFVQRQQQEAGGVRQVGICQYRKFVTRERIGVPSTNYQVMDVLSKDKLAVQDLAELMLPDPDRPFLVGQPGSFTMNGVSYDYLYQYKDVHHIEDFLRFTAAAVELGVLSKQDVHPLFSETIFFPGGIELGFYPADFWVQGISALERVVRFCVQRYPVPREGAQARSWAFCMERMGSYLMLQHVRTHGLKDQFGYLNLITEADNLSYVPGA
jgi:hypothetical protein